MASREAVFIIVIESSGFAGTEFWHAATGIVVALRQRPSAELLRRPAVA
jgi:hypothetical protein